MCMLCGDGAGSGACAEVNVAVAVGACGGSCSCVACGADRGGGSDLSRILVNARSASSISSIRSKNQILLP